MIRTRSHRQMPLAHQHSHSLTEPRPGGSVPPGAVQRLSPPVRHQKQSKTHFLPNHWNKWLRPGLQHAGILTPTASQQFRVVHPTC
jgi:hypothetical protein